MGKKQLLSIWYEMCSYWRNDSNQISVKGNTMESSNCFKVDFYKQDSNVQHCNI